MRRFFAFAALGLVYAQAVPAHAADVAAPRGHATPRAGAVTPAPSASAPAPAPAPSDAPPAAGPDVTVVPSEETPEPGTADAPDGEPGRPSTGSMEPADATAEPAPKKSAPEPAPVTKPAEEDAESERVPLARDTLGGHIGVGVTPALIVPFGSFQSGSSQADVMGPGFGVLADVEFGVSRTVMLGLYGELGMPDGQGAWSGGNAQTLAVGPFVRYHLVQGVRFDPWVGFGAGFRHTKRGDESYTGIDFARLQLGGDYYASKNIGFGPLVELALGTFVGADGATLGTKAVNAHLIVGARFTFDGPGK
jgi:hypothetical protein